MSAETSLRSVQDRRPTSLAISDPFLLSIGEKPKPLLITVRQGCELLNIGQTKMYELINRGIVEAVHIGRGMRLKFKSVEALAENGVP